MTAAEHQVDFNRRKAEALHRAIELRMPWKMLDLMLRGFDALQARIDEMREIEAEQAWEQRRHTRNQIAARNPSRN